MAKLENFMPLMAKWEGKHVNNRYEMIDGISRKITKDDLNVCVIKDRLWDYCKCDMINSQAIANLLADWVFANGIVAIEEVQFLLGLKVNGAMSKKMIETINSAPQRDLFLRIKSARTYYVESICAKHPAYICFRKEWIRRVDAVRWVPAEEAK